VFQFSKSSVSLDDNIFYSQGKKDHVAFNYEQKPSRIINLDDDIILSATVEVSAKKHIIERHIENFQTVLSDLGGILGILRVFSVGLIFIIHYKGAYQDMTQKIFIQEVKKDRKSKSMFKTTTGV
jgi:hypothetical protein